jgi:hypothetical protein
VKSRLFSMLLTGCAVGASAQAPVVHARLMPGKGIIVGQPVHLIVEVLVPNYFTGSPDFPTFELENAIVVLPEETPVNLNEQVDGHSYAGIQRAYWLYPQQPGDFRLPPAQITVSYASAPPKSTEAHLSLPSLTFHADIPAAARGLNYFLPTTRLTMQQSWSSPLSQLRVGDTVERTITVTTVKMQGMLIPPLTMEAPAGIRIYTEEPKVQDQKTDRGEFVFGRRTQTVKYFIQKAGNYALPAIELKWWNLSSNRLATATLPAVHFIAVPNPDYVAELPPEPEPVTAAQATPINLRSRYRWIRIFVPTVLAMLFLVWLVHKYAPRMYRSLMTGRERYRHSEAADFQKLIGACKHDDAPSAYQRLLQWLRHFRPEKPIDQFLQQTNDDELTHQVNSLTSELFARSHDGKWQGLAMAKCLKEHRRALSRRPRKHQKLPLLNP